ncbi:riboflavin biosynthesis protein RibF [Sphingorhabdus lutea]|uniref:Riboflavin biosynthesis protein n=1 Tax=Sphingorhabdus lutea TaxID=1913578 RepID=A0A1L3J9K0_9SPHN|nr:bifunctional riboflavin kinase/FAD synthetase [Sphingorhabdus lutea]APG61795.1 riboflavin biosynthesis protein RibF [Sphingorhabdus lutea]
MAKFSSHDILAGDNRGAIIAMGNFDGFHLGHQAVAGAAKKWAMEEGRPFYIATFDPHPVRYFMPHAEPFRLTSLNQREKIFSQFGADAMLVFDFNETLANMSAADFVTKLLAEQLGVAGVVTGQDFTFGKGRSGNAQNLSDYGAPVNLRSRALSPITNGDEVISSSRIRAALKNGDIATAQNLLTRPFAIEGEVQHGDKNGRKFGYPTANIDMGSYLRPKFGIYAVRGKLPDGGIFDGVANLGIRPSFTPPKLLLEPYFFDFQGDLYHQMIEVELLHFIREEAKFDDMDALITQMDQDSMVAKNWLVANLPII